ncbi:MAG: hypothetical protein ACRD5J_06655 [Nitrososphaeraceae archaeon]
MNLFAAMQFWPVFNNLARAARVTVRFRSASSKTIKGSLPPNYNTSFFSSLAFPVLTLPVTESIFDWTGASPTQ